MRTLPHLMDVSVVATGGYNLYNASSDQQFTHSGGSLPAAAQRIVPSAPRVRLPIML